MPSTVINANQVKQAPKVERKQKSVTLTVNLSYAVPYNPVSFNPDGSELFLNGSLLEKTLKDSARRYACDASISKLVLKVEVPDKEPASATAEVTKATKNAAASLPKTTAQIVQVGSVRGEAIPENRPVMVNGNNPTPPAVSPDADDEDFLQATDEFLTNAVGLVADTASNISDGFNSGLSASGLENVKFGSNNKFYFKNATNGNQYFHIVADGGKIATTLKSVGTVASVISNAKGVIDTGVAFSQAEGAVAKGEALGSGTGSLVGSNVGSALGAKAGAALGGVAVAALAAAGVAAAPVTLIVVGGLTLVGAFAGGKLGEKVGNSVGGAAGKYVGGKIEENPDTFDKILRGAVTGVAGSAITSSK